MLVRKQLLVAQPVAAMFDVIEGAEHYPSFLPWCAGVEILSRDADHVRALIKVNYHGVHFEFTTHNPKRRPEWMGVTLEHGPFRHFHGEWVLAPLGDLGCRIEFRLEYDFASTLMTKLAGPVFERISDTLVDALVTYADRTLPARGEADTVQAPAAAESPRHELRSAQGANDG